MDACRFEFNPPQARMLIARALRRYGGAHPGGRPGETLELEPGWNPRCLYGDQLGAAEDLIAAAVEAQAIMCPAATELQLICFPDPEGALYMWRVRPPAPGFTIASDLMQMIGCLGDGSKGARGALALVREAVDTGNEILSVYERAAGLCGAGK